MYLQMCPQNNSLALLYGCFLKKKKKNQNEQDLYVARDMAPLRIDLQQLVEKDCTVCMYAMTPCGGGTACSLCHGRCYIRPAKLDTHLEKNTSF